MRILKQVTEDEVIAEFLKAEINSKRFGGIITKALEGKPKKIVTNPDLENKKENQFRRELLGKVRGVWKKRGLV